MDLENFQSDIMRLYYGELRHDLQALAKKYDIPEALALSEWQKFEHVSKCFSSLPQHEPSQMSVNKVLAHARERALQSEKKSFWSWLRQPGYAFASLVLVGVLAFVMQQKAPSTITVAQNQLIADVSENSDYQNVIRQLFSTPFDRDHYDPTYRLPQTQKHYLNSMVSSVSLGKSGDSTDSFLNADELDQKMLSNQISFDELDTLFFRARKLEKLGYYQAALRDYLFISKNYPEFAFQKTMPLSIAGCYEKLGDRKTAAVVLEAYGKSYGKNGDLEIWIDQLKSESL